MFFNSELAAAFASFMLLTAFSCASLVILLRALFTGMAAAADASAASASQVNGIVSGMAEYLTSQMRAVLLSHTRYHVLSNTKCYER